MNHSLLNDLLSEDLSMVGLPERMDWVEKVLLWCFPRGDGKSDARVRLLLRTLDKNAAWYRNFQTVLQSVLEDCRFLHFFTYVGVAVEKGLWGDISERVRSKFVPSGGSQNFSEIFGAVFRSEEQIQELRSLSPATLREVQRVFAMSTPASVWQKRQQDMRESLTKLSIHVAHHGLSNQVRVRVNRQEISDGNPFVRLASEVQSGNLGQLEVALKQADQAAAMVHEHMEEGGVSVELVNRMETIAALLGRIRKILACLSSASVENQTLAARDLVVSSVEAQRLGRSVRTYLRHHFYLLSRKIVERNGQSGEHYIARTASDRMLLFKSAVGGGIIVIFMTLAKLSVAALKPAPLFLACEIAVIYSVGFLTMQFTGATLATKIPSFTASGLAKLLGEVRRKSDEIFRSELRLVLKSQAIALMGNLAGVFILGSLINWLSGALFHHGPVKESYAQHFLSDLNPFTSFAVALGVLTGVQLWLSSLAGGWFENWVVFNQLPSAIVNHRRLRRLFGEPALQRLADWIKSHASGIATNIALGTLFGFTPLLGALFRSNWNGHHVTISTTTALFSVGSLSSETIKEELGFAALGLCFIAFANFASSFGLALYVAASAQKMNMRRVLFYLGAAFRSK